jgi:hypothetical protein
MASANPGTPGGPGDQDQAARPLQEIDDGLLRQADLGERQQLLGDPAQHGRIALLLAHHAGPEPLAPGVRHAEVDGAVFLHLGPLFLGAQGPAHAAGGLLVPDLPDEGLQHATDPHDRWAHGVDVEVGCTGGDASLQQGGDGRRHQRRRGPGSRRGRRKR